MQCSYDSAMTAYIAAISL